MHLPLIDISSGAVRIHHLVIGVGHHDGAVGTADGRPDDVRRGVGCDAVVDYDWQARGEAEVEGGFGEAVVDWVVYLRGRGVRMGGGGERGMRAYAVGGGVADGEF